jgi:transcriptional regulator with XRE-family HTH domain
MSDAAAKSLGRKIAFYRNQRGLSQRHFGALIERSEAWVSQVERGQRRIDRMTVLRRVAEALDVPIAELAADTPVVSAASSRPGPADELRTLLSSSLSLALAVSPPPCGTVAALIERAEDAWHLAHAAAYAELGPVLAALLPSLEAAARAATGRDRRRVYVALARAYHACSAALVKLADLPAAWVASDRAIAAAERSGDQLLIAEGAFRLVLVFQAFRQYELAEQTATTAVAALQPLVEQSQQGAISLQGVLYLQRAVIAARQNRAGEAYAHLRAGHHLAARLGEDRNDYNTEFGPTNIALYEVAVAVELGDAGTALRVAASVDTSGLSAERRSRLLLDVARAYMQRRVPEAAILALLDAEEVAPEQARRHWITNALIRDLDASGYGSDPRLKLFAHRATTS